MKRLLMILKRNVIYLPDIIFRLFWYSRKNDRHSKQEKYNFICKISYKAINKGNLLVKVYGSSNLPEENGFILIIREFLMALPLFMPVIYHFPQ